MIGIGLFEVFLYSAAEPDKTMYVTLGFDRNSDFYRGANFFENVKNDEKTTFSNKNLKLLIFKLLMRKVSHFKTAHA